MLPLLLAGLCRLSALAFLGRGGGAGGEGGWILLVAPQAHTPLSCLPALALSGCRTMLLR